MEKTMLELFIYYVISVEEDTTQDYSLNICIKKMEETLDKIKCGDFDEWSNYLQQFRSKSQDSHPVAEKQKELLSLSQEEYKFTLEKAKKLLEKYSMYGTNNYDALYLLSCEEEVEELAQKIILKSKTTEKLLKLIKDMKENNRDNMLVIDEMCERYLYGDGIEKSFENAIDGWEMIGEYYLGAKYSLALCYKNEKGIEDKEKAYKIFCDIMNDDFRAKYEVAKANFLGEGTEKNYLKAFELFNELIGKVPYDLERCIEAYLGEIYFRGLGIEQDKEKGFLLLEKAWESRMVKLDYKMIKEILKEYYKF